MNDYCVTESTINNFEGGDEPVAQTNGLLLSRVYWEKKRLNDLFKAVDVLIDEHRPIPHSIREEIDDILFRYLDAGVYEEDLLN